MNFTTVRMYTCDFFFFVNVLVCACAVSNILQCLLLYCRFHIYIDVVVDLFANIAFSIYESIHIYQYIYCATMEIQLIHRHDVVVTGILDTCVFDAIQYNIFDFLLLQHSFNKHAQLRAKGHHLYYNRIYANVLHTLHIAFASQKIQ